jgi:CheY-like chemotaxis protein
MKKLLIVDDKVEIRKLLAITLGLDYEIILANSGMDALKMIEDSRPTAVLLDVMMPGKIDGFEVLKKVKENPEYRDIRMVLITAKGNSEDVKKADLLGADAYFIKPFSPVKLIAWLRENISLD